MASNTVIRTNVLAINANRNLGKVANAQSKSSQKLSSGYRINNAGDDAAGLAISETMRGQIRGLDQASRNAQDGISLMQTAEGAVGEITNMVQRVRELGIQAGNDTLTSGDRNKVKLEMDQLLDEIDATAERTQFNSKDLIKSKNSFTFQVGANNGQTMTFSVQKGMKVASIFGKATTDIKKQTSAMFSGADDTKMRSGAKAMVSYCDTALKNVNDFRAKIGAAQNRMEYTISNLDLSSENLSASESRIRDTDMAKEMMNLTKANVLQQAATSMLAQANQAPQNVLQLVQ